MRPAIIVHGGAWDIPLEAHENHKNGCKQAAAAGYRKMLNGGSAIDAVENAVRHMEEDPTFDAGRGSFLNKDGEIELDAIIMEGDDLGLGAVAAVQHILHPVSLARAVMDNTPHCMLVGEGALRFARSIGMEEIEVPELLTCRELERWRSIQASKTFDQKSFFRKADGDYKQKGTVGAVAIDSEGLIAAATSTGGTPNKMAGRVGDSPLVGCGNYADSNIGGVSATGWGESIMKTVLARKVCDFLERGKTEWSAVKDSILYLEKRVNGFGGVILISKEGKMAYSFNTPHMAIGWVDASGHLGAEVKSL
ncbi:MAG: isoaspartyl peptidase/L-asparaginase [Methanomassiliicoccales archaeon]